MKAKDKAKYISELHNIISKLNVDNLTNSPDQALIDQRVRRSRAIFTNFDYGMGEKLEKLICDFLEVARAGKRIDHIRNLANDIKNFIIQATDDMDVYVIEPKNHLGQTKIKRRLEKEGLWVQSNIEGEDEHLFVGKKDGAKDKIHLVIDGKTGEIRIDPKDQAPHDLLSEVKTILKFKTGERILSTRSSLAFLEDNGGATNIQNGLSPSSLEKKVLKILNREYQQVGYPRYKIIDTHKELEILDGTYVGTLNSSKYLKIEGEFYMMTDDGIRYIDSLTKNQIDSIILPEEQHKQDTIMEKQRFQFEKNKKNAFRNSAK